MSCHTTWQYILHFMRRRRSTEHRGNVQSTAAKLTRPDTSLDDTCHCITPSSSSTMKSITAASHNAFNATSSTTSHVYEKHHWCIRMFQHQILLVLRMMEVVVTTNKPTPNFYKNKPTPNFYRPDALLSPNQWRQSTERKRSTLHRLAHSKITWDKALIKSLYERKI